MHTYVYYRSRIKCLLFVPKIQLKSVYGMVKNGAHTKGVLKGEGADLALRPPEKILTCPPLNIQLPALAQLSEGHVRIFSGGLSARSAPSPFNTPLLYAPAS